MTVLDHVLAAIAAVAAGAINAIAGGGTLVSFPVLLAIGVPPVSASVTNTVALCPGYLGGAMAQSAAVREQRALVRRLVPAAVIGGLLGSVLLLRSSDEAFEALVPVLLALASLLLAFQDRLRARLVGAAPAAGPTTAPPWAVAPVMLVSIYGGYFGAGLGIMLLAVLGAVLHAPLDRLNALKQVLSLVINVTAAVWFLRSGRVEWSLAAVMAVGSLAGGHAGGRFVGRVRPDRLRPFVVCIGLAVAVVYAVRTWW